FRNHSNDKFLLLVDDVKVFYIPTYDGAITSVLPPYAELLRVPITQSYPVQLGATIQNKGAQPLTNVVVTAHVKVNGVDVHTAATAPPTFNPATSTAVIFASYVVTQLGVVTVDYVLTSTNEDVPSDNSMTSTAATVTTNELGRDEGTAVTELGIGAGNGG